VCAYNKHRLNRENLVSLTEMDAVDGRTKKQVVYQVDKAWLIAEHKRVGLEVPYHLLSDGAWHQDRQAELFEYMENDMYVDEFDFMAFYHWIHEARNARDPVSYLRKPPCFAVDEEDYDMLDFEIDEESVDA